MSSNTAIVVTVFSQNHIASFTLLKGGVKFIYQCGTKGKYRK